MQANDKTDGRNDAACCAEENSGTRTFISENSFHQPLFTTFNEISHFRQACRRHGHDVIDLFRG